MKTYISTPPDNVKVYRALVTAGDPIEAVVLQNTFAGSLTWTPFNTGEYWFESALGEFTANKTFVSVTLSTKPTSYTTALAVYGSRSTASLINFIGGGVDDTKAWQSSDWGGVAYVEILVYP